MIDVFRVADLLVAHAVKHFGEEIDLIGYYGSYAQGKATERSDLDIFFIPADGKNPPAARAVLVEGILFDFWPIRWERMAAFATGRTGWQSAPALVHHAKVLHARSEAAADRLQGLKQRILDLQGPEARPEMIRRALDAFKCVSLHLGNLRLAVADNDLTDMRNSGWEVILAALECLTLANQTFFHRGGTAIFDQLARLQARPADLERLITVISTSMEPAEIAGAADALALGTRQVLRRCQASLPAQRAVTERLGDVYPYPEIHAFLGKIYSACEQQHPVAAGCAARMTQYDVSQVLAEFRNGGNHPDFNRYSEFSDLYREIGLPDLLSCPPHDLPALAEQAGAFDARVRQWFCEQSSELHEFTTLEEFERSLQHP
ncbi:MAG: nucleotidyltransferase domain-containing protein [Armatimonadota bacterium]